MCSVGPYSGKLVKHSSVCYDVVTAIIVVSLAVVNRGHSCGLGALRHRPWCGHSFDGISLDFMISWYQIEFFSWLSTKESSDSFLLHVSGFVTPVQFLILCQSKPYFTELNEALSY